MKRKLTLVLSLLLLLILPIVECEAKTNTIRIRHSNYNDDLYPDTPKLKMGGNVVNTYDVGYDTTGRFLFIAPKSGKYVFTFNGLKSKSKDFDYPLAVLEVHKKSKLSYIADGYRLVYFADDMSRKYLCNKEWKELSNIDDETARSTVRLSVNLKKGNCMRFTIVYTSSEVAGKGLQLADRAIGKSQLKVNVKYKEVKR